MDRQTVEQLILQLCRDDEVRFKPEHIQNAIDLALNRINLDAPHSIKEDIAAMDQNVLALPTAFDDEFSDIIDVEFPIGLRPRAYIQDAAVYEEPTGKVLELPNYVTGTLRVCFTAKHQLDDTTSTIKKELTEAFASFAAGILCEQLATIYAHDSDSTISADVVQHSDKADKFSRRARNLKKVYTDQVKPSQPGNTSAGAVVSFPSRRRSLL